MTTIDSGTAPAGTADRAALSSPYAGLDDVLRQYTAEADRTAALPAQVLEALRAHGLLDAAVPRAYGGRGGGASLVNRLVEHVAAVDPSVAIILFQHYAVTARITEWGSPAQREYWLRRLADGGCLAASAWSETGAGADKRRIATEAVPVPGGWVLNGVKSFATGAGLAQVYLVLAHTSGARPGEPEPADGREQGYGGTDQTFFLIESDTPGLDTDTGMDLLGMRASATGSVRLTDCRVPESAVLGPLGEAPTVIAGVRESGATLGAVAVGIADAVYQLAAAHVRTRGADDVAERQLAEIATLVAGARAAVDSAGRRDGPHPGILTLQSKVLASTTAEEVCARATRLLGSAGFLRDHPVNRLARDLRAVALMGPTNDLCLQLIARELKELDS